MRNSRLDRIRITPGQLIPASFLLVIIIGALLLMLPISSASGESVGALTALFTSTTSVCVTGLVVVDTYAEWSVFGQFVIMILIQIGGLGVVAIGSMVMILSRKKVNLGVRKLLGESLNLERDAGLLRFLIRVFKGVFVVELAGTVLCAIVFIPMMGFSKGLWAALFQSISAFCNAGMDLIGPNSMIDLRTSGILMSTTMILIVLGGIGFVVWFDVIDGIRAARRNRYGIRTMISHLPEHTKLVITMTLFLIIGGAAFVFISEYSNPDTLGNLSLGGKIANSLFQSITFRTAGFATLPQEKLKEATCMLGYILMFIGGSPVGTAGGIKTVTAFLFFVNALSYIRGRKENVVFNRGVSEELMRKAAAIAFVSIGTVFVMTILLLTRGGIALTDAVYEVISALGTVGLSRAITPRLDTIGRVIIIISMYLGRIGPISMAIFFTKGISSSSKIKHAEGTFRVG